jgi:type II secretory pathway component PulJ
MGASTIFDIVSATVVGSLLLLMALRLNAQAVETNAVYQNNLNLQESIVALVDIVESDFR